MHKQPENYVTCNGAKLKPKDLSESQIIKLRSLNATLYAIEQTLTNEAIKIISQAEKRVNDSEDWVTGFELESVLTFQLKESDPLFDEDTDNILVQLSERSTRYKQSDSLLGDGLNHNEFQYVDGHVMQEEVHCWLYHCLYDHTDLGWRNILKVGAIDFDIDITYQGSVPLKKIEVFKNDQSF